MDIARPDLKRKRNRQRWVIGLVVALLLGGASFAVARLKPAAPSVERSTVWTDTVKRGPMVRQVRGIGTLVPREDKIRLIPAETEATVVRLRVLPGAHVQPDTVLMDLTDPQLEQDLLDAQLGLQAAQVDLTNLKAKLQSDLMAQRAGAATVNADQSQAQKQAETDKALYDLGVISGLTYSASKGKADEMNTRGGIEADRLKVNEQAIATQLEVQQTKVAQARALLALKEKQRDALQVRAGIAGVLTELPHQVGEHVDPGATLAKVVQPDQLKASLKIAETQARDIQLGQPAEIDTHNGVIGGRVTRIDPAVINGTVTVDAELLGALPLGARPDLSVDGTIDLDRLTPDGGAVRVPVKVGRASVNAIQILGGLNEGDTVILSDMSRWDAADRIRLN